MGGARRTAIAAAALIVSSGVLAVPADAYWHSSGSGSGSASTATLGAPTAVTVPATSMSSVAVSWTAAAGAAPTGYYVVRDQGTNSTAACGTTVTGLTSATSCTDTSVPDGTYNYVVIAVFRSWSSASASSGSIVVSTATQLAFSTQPTSTTSTTPISPAVQVKLESGSGATVLAANISIAIAIGSNPGSGTVSGTLTALTNSSGIANFAGLSIDKAAAGYTLTATSAGLTAATSSAFTISVGVAAKLAFTTSPTAAFAASAFFAQPVVTIQDAGGNTVTTSTSGVTLSLTTANGAVLSCTAAQPAVAGVASFAGCAINNVGSYTLTAQSGSLTSAVSATFTIVAAPTHLAWNSPTTTVCGAASGTSFALVYFDCELLSAGTFTSKVSLTDSSGNVVTNLGPTLTVTLTTAHGTVTATTLTILHGQSTSSTTSTFTPAYPLLAITDTVIAAATSVSSATAVLHALLV
jgi:hypothetical protein